MKLSKLLQTLDEHPDTQLKMKLPNQSFVPAHFHVTEVGLVRKDFIDCGGTVRSTATCVIQVWVATDVDHRISTTKLQSIFDSATKLLGSDDLQVEIEFEDHVISQYPLRNIAINESSIELELGSKHTGCLAPQLCLPVADSAGCCSTGECC
jgi:hypothetical protein